MHAFFIIYAVGRPHIKYVIFYAVGRPYIKFANDFWMMQKQGSNMFVYFFSGALVHELLI